MRLGMASRRRRDKNSKQIEHSGTGSPLKLSRRDVARRELVHAIELHFDQGDPVVIHLLAAASRDVSAPVARAAGKRVFGDVMEEFVRPEYLASWKAFVRTPYNFFKHGGADPEKELAYFDPTTNDMLILEAYADYREAFGKHENEMNLFLAWHVVTYPDMLNELGMSLRDVVSKGFEGLDAQGRLKRGRDVLKVIGDGGFG